MWILAALVAATGVVGPLHVTTAHAAVTGALQITFPWGTSINADGANANGRFNYGPHDHSGTDYGHVKPWNALDLAPADNRVYAARGGNAYVDCANEEIYVVHGDGYVTSYTHLDPTTIQISNGQYVYRGTWLANVKTTAFNCGSGSPPHVHFAIWYVNAGDTFRYNDSQAIDWGMCNGTSPCPTAVPWQPQVGGWTVDDGTAPSGTLYEGCITNLNGVRYCGLSQGVTTYILNDTPNSQLTVARRPQGGTEDLFVRGTTLHAYHAPTDSSGTPAYWEDHSGIIMGSPTGVWDTNTTRLDMYVVGIDGLI